MNFEFATVTRIVFGSGKLKEIGGITVPFGNRPLVVTGGDVRRAEVLLGLLREAGLNPFTYSPSGEPTIETISEGVAVAKTGKADCVIGFGGGSALDAGKAIAIMTTNEGGLLDYLEVIGAGKPFSHPSLPFIAVPTTAGTGAEVTRNAVIGSPEHRAKASLRSAHMLPRVAVVDPALTLSLPDSVTASSGMDALTQLIEPFVCSRANPLTDALCREGISRVARSLHRAFADGTSTSAREDMAVASLFGGLALSNSGLGAVHGFANPIGGMFSAPHGTICAVLLPHVMRANFEGAQRHQAGSHIAERYCEIARMLTGHSEASAGDGLQWVESLARTLRVPTLKEFGISDSDLDEIVFKAQKASSMKANPVALSAEELREILSRAL